MLMQGKDKRNLVTKKEYLNKKEIKDISSKRNLEVKSVDIAKKRHKLRLD
jgi:hypothetical protein